MRTRSSVSSMSGPEADEPGGDDPVEIEWQFDALDLRPVERWLATLPALAVETRHGGTVTALARPPRRLVDSYLDCDDWRIARAGFVVRTRRRGRHDEVTLKDKRPAEGSGLRQRLEVTEVLPPSGLAALGHEGPVGRRLRAIVGSRRLHEVLQVRTRRRPFALRVGGVDVAEIALDDTMIVVVHRPVQHDWSFPKGKLEPGETLEMAALREVEEETGMICDLLRFIGHTEYVDRKGRPKAVAYWVMAEETGSFRPNDEVDELRWLSLEGAARLLSYPRDRELVAVLMAADQVEPLI